MAFDQAQSARLGQRTPLENPGIRIVNSPAEVGAPYRGQLVFASNDATVYVYLNEWIAVGGGGGAGGGGSFNYQEIDINFASPAQQWVVQHNLNQRYVEVSTYNDQNHEIVGDISFDTNDQLTVTWANPISGHVVVRNA